jgi:hypothetical protein
VDPRDRLLSAGKRMSDPVESVAQRVAERVIDLIVGALDVNSLIRRIDANALLDQVDVNDVLSKVDVSALVERVDVARLIERVDIDALLRQLDVEALLDRVDVNALVQRIDVDVLVQQTDLGAILAGSSGGLASEALDAARSQAVGIDQFIDRWVWRLLRRRPRPFTPLALADPRTQP